MRRALLAALLAAALPTVAIAKDKPFVESDAVADKPAVIIDPARAYILLRTDAPAPLMLVKDPSPEDQKVYDARRAEAFAKARARYARDLEDYRTQSAAGAKAKPPVEPTEANFAFTPFQALASTVIGPMSRFAKQDRGGSTYLQAITPGTYRFYGMIGPDGHGGLAGTCFCMGSVRFDARTGEIADLGRIGYKAPGAKAERDKEDDSRPPPLYFILTPAMAGMDVDPRLPASQVRPVRYRPAGKLANFLGITVNRLRAMPGVMRYDRDRIVDLTGATAAEVAPDAAPEPAAGQ